MFSAQLKNKSVLAFAIGVVLTGSSGSFAFSPWDPGNDPNRLETDYETRFAKLKTDVMLVRLPWADTYWPSQNGGLAWRWCDEPGYCEPLADEGGQALSVKTPAALADMTPQQLRRLSAIEKLDIFLGHTDQSDANKFYYWTKRELRRVSPTHANPVIDPWEGVCNGWAVASLHHPEPKPVKAPVNLQVNGQNVTVNIPFSSSDVKGLMSLYYYIRMAENPSLYRTLGSKCTGYTQNYRVGRGQLRQRMVMNYFTAECEDTNAGAFHVVLANQIGERGEGFIADVDRGHAIWNHPIVGYKTVELGQRKPSAGASIEADREIIVQTTMYYQSEATPNRRPYGAANSQALATKLYQYALEINDASGKIVGGSWISEDRPDFLWKMEKLNFEGGFSALDKLLLPLEQ